MTRPKIEAVVFDMDGLMLDTERLARRVWRKTLAEFGYELSDDTYSRFIGLTAQDSRLLMKRLYGADFPMEESETRAIFYYRSALEENGVPLKKGLPELLDLLDERSLGKAVATSTEERLARPILERAGILKRFDIVVTGDKVKRGKPAPDIFLTAALMMGIVPQACMVLEDSPNGIRAAKSAGMLPVMVPDLIRVPKIIKPLLFACVSDLLKVCELISNHS